MAWGPGAPALALALCACGSELPPERDCFARVWSAAPAQVLGSWDGFAAPGIATEAQADGWQLARFELPAGAYGYLVDDGTGATLDAHNPLATWDTQPVGDERELSLLEVGDCAAPRLAIDAVAVSDGSVRIEATFLTARAGDALAEVEATTGTGTALTVEQADADSGRIVLSAPIDAGKHTVTIDARDVAGRRAEAPRALAWPDQRDGAIYELMIDRFRGSAGPLAPPATAGSRAGGTLAGAESAIADGSLEALGVDTLWLSPVYANPNEARLGLDGQLYESYHGYWPVDPRAVDERIGGDAALAALIASAHARGVRVLLDLVPNHVYETSARYEEHASEWFSPEGCVCGTPSCPWSEHIQRCWFASYLPDVRWQSAEATRAGIEDALDWLTRFDVDGFRIDAVPMMPRAATRRLADRLRRSVAPQSSLFLLGEVFTGPGPDGFASLKHHLGPAGLDSVFDFPLMWALHGAIATGKGSFEEAEAIVALEEAELAGSGALLARMLDNHDVPRFVSVAAGDAWSDPWLSPAAQPLDDEPYLRLQLGLAAIFTLPGVPVLYQGDEIGLAGGGDPDNRRVMPADAELLPAQLVVRATTQALGRLRRCSAALRGDGRVALTAQKRGWAYLRGGEALVLLWADEAAGAIDLPLGATPAGRFVDALSGELVDVAGGASVPMAALSFRVLLPENDPCVAL